jgi:perosamine synthetase
MIPLVAPCITGRDRGYLRQRLSDGLLDDESEVRRFEEAFAERVGCDGAVAVCSGTVALELALEVLEVGAVSIPTYTCVALRTATRRHAVSYIDSRFDVSAARMMTPIGNRPAIITHMFGNETFVGVGAGEWLIEDWTLSFGGVASLVSHVGVCSTHESKMISTGRGGGVFSNNHALLERVRELVDARSVGMSATQAALGVSQLGQLDAFIERRRELAAGYSARFAEAGIECPDPDSGSVFFRYLIGVEDPEAKVAALAERGVEAGRGVFPPLHRLAGLSDDRFPGATECVNRILSVPCHPSITDEQAAYIYDKVVEVCA